ncbi:MAG: HEAT repeat domain-containing protein [Chloroflexota bacterium]|nr:HEAT repeat domain-containing protein [Chloroflexota bacterium]
MLSVICSTTLYLAIPAPALQRWHFDPLSALIGAGVALLLAWLIYHFRDELRLGWGTATASLLRLRSLLQASADDRYRELVVARMRSLTVPAHTAPLDAVFIEPKLLAPSQPSPSIPESELTPAIPQELPLRRILGGHPQLAILGEPGTGKTALLAYIALSCARSTMAAEEETEAETMLGPDRKRLPLYAPLPAIDWDEPNEAAPEREEEEGEGEEKEEEEAPTDNRQDTKPEDDAVEKLLNAVVSTVGGKSGLTSVLRQYLEAGRAIVLADGWDELPPQQRQQATVWLTELNAALPGNLWLVGAGTRGYAPLIEAGFVPLTLAPWNVMQVEEFARRWVEAYTPEDGDAIVSAHKLITELQSAARTANSPLELALRAFVYLAAQEAPTSRGKLFDRALELLLQQEQADAWMSATGRMTLGQLAIQLQQEEHTTCQREEIEAAIETALPPAEELPTNATTRVFRALTGERGLLHLASADRYAFVHPLWQAYLAARQLIAVAPATLVERLDDPHWSEPLRFYAELGDMGSLVTEWLRTPDDMFYTRLRTLGAWIGAAPGDAAWRNGAMAILARVFLEPGHPAQAQQTLAEALAATSMPGVAYLFKQALQHPSAETRAAAVLGLARIATESDLPILEAALEDEALIVREAAVRGLAHLRVDVATRWLEHVLLEGDDALRPLAAERLAQCGDQGRAILIEAAKSEDVIIRRGAVAGLAQIKAQEALEKIAREDEQWIVRSAATAALENMKEEKEKTAGVAPPPEIGQLPWLISWAAAQGEGAGVGDAARRTLQRALSTGDTSVRLNAVQMLSQVGRPDDVELLRTTMNDPEPVIASTAVDALNEISKRYDLRIERIT